MHTFPLVIHVISTCIYLDGTYPTVFVLRDLAPTSQNPSCDSRRFQTFPLSQLKNILRAVHNWRSKIRNGRIYLHLMIKKTGTGQLSQTEIFTFVIALIIQVVNPKVCLLPYLCQSCVPCYDRFYRT